MFTTLLIRNRVSCPLWKCCFCVYLGLIITFFLFTGRMVRKCLEYVGIKITHRAEVLSLNYFHWTVSNQPCDSESKNEPVLSGGPGAGCESVELQLFPAHCSGTRDVPPALIRQQRTDQPLMSVIEVLSEDAEDVTAHHHPPHLQRTTHHKDKHESLVHLHFSLRSTIILVSFPLFSSLWWVLYSSY